MKNFIILFGLLTILISGCVSSLQIQDEEKRKPIFNSNLSEERIKEIYDSGKQFCLNNQVYNVRFDEFISFNEFETISHTDSGVPTYAMCLFIDENGQKNYAVSADIKFFGIIAQTETRPREVLWEFEGSLDNYCSAESYYDFVNELDLNSGIFFEVKAFHYSSICGFKVNCPPGKILSQDEKSCVIAHDVFEGEWNCNVNKCVWEKVIVK